MQDQPSKSDQTLQDAALRYRAALPAGQLWRFAVTDLDPGGVPSYSVTVLPGVSGGGHGYGATALEAEVGALGELHERLQSALAVPQLSTEMASYREMVAMYGEASVLEPPALPLDAGAAYTPHLPRYWLTVRRYPDDHEVFVPLEAVASSASELPTGYTPLFQPVSNGLGAGFDVPRALAHGVLECLQRDGNSVNYRALDQGHVIDLDGSLPADIQTVLDHFDAKGVQVRVKLAATDFGLVNLYVVGDDANPPLPLMLGACGEACHVDRTVALRKALFEYGASRTRLAFDHGPLQQLARVVPEGYLAAHREHFPPLGEEPRALRAMLAWQGRDNAQRRDLLTAVFQQTRATAWRELPDAQVSKPTDLLATLHQRLGDLAIYYRDVTTAYSRERGVVVCKVIIPSLEVETASYGRIGIRNLKRLLERDSPLVGLGTPPLGAEQVVLRAADEAELGQPAWFDLAALRCAVGPLYTLYREPSRHAAQYVQRGFPC